MLHSIEIQNTNSSPGQCTNGTNPIQTFPQAQNAPSHSPWLDANNSTSNVQYPSVDSSAPSLLASRVLPLALPLSLFIFI